MSDSDDEIVVGKRRIKSNLLVSDEEDSATENEFKESEKNPGPVDSVTNLPTEKKDNDETSQDTGKKKRRKKSTLMSSESENENDVILQLENDDEMNVAVATKSSDVKPRRFQLLSEDDFSDYDTNLKEALNSDNESQYANLSEKEKRRKKLQKLNEQKKCISVKLEKKKQKSMAIDNNFEGESKKSKTKTQEEETANLEDNYEPPKKEKKPRSRKPKSTDDKEKKLKEPKKKSKKQKDAMLEIKSTTQKMIREGKISLPYHQPKQHSLDEFLQRRNNVPSIPLRASSNLMTLVGERLSKKEEEVAEFYKSESEHSGNEQTLDENALAQRINDRNILSPNKYKEQVLDNISNELLCNSNNARNENENTMKVDSVSESSVWDALNIEPQGSVGFIDDQIAPKNSDVIADEENSNPETKIDASVLQSVSIETDLVSLNEESTSTKVTSHLDTSSILDPTDDTANTAPPDAVLGGSHLTDREEKLPKISENAEAETVHKISKNEDETLKTGEIEEIAILNENACNTAMQDIEDSCVMASNELNSSIRTDSAVLADAETIRNKKLALLSTLKLPLSNVKLNKNDNYLLQFEVDSLPKPGVQKFMEKFANHVAVRNKSKKKSTKLSIISTQTDQQGDVVDVIKETLMLKQPNDEEKEVDDKFAIPGYKYSMFKEAMLKTLVSKKADNWKKYQQEKRNLYERSDSDEENIEEKEIGERKLHFEPYHPEDEPDDEDLVEDDVDLKEKHQRKKNEYLDEEAEVDFDEEENLMDVSDDEVDSENDDIAHVSENSDAEVQDENGGERDSDEEILKNSCLEFSKFKSTEKEKPENCESHFPTKLFKNNVTGSDLENKLLGFDSISSQSKSQPEDITGTQILSICSGKFVTQPMVHKSQHFGDSQFIDDSQDFNLSVQETNDSFSIPNEVTSTVDKTSVLLSENDSDTEELFNRKKKAARIEDSDEDSQEVDSSQESDNEENENDETDEVDDDNTGEQDEFDGEVGYNSEEEIVNYKGTLPTEFFENEAELSESEWGSEDENEKDMDELEKEAGDDDDINIDKLKEELGRIHMRRLMDDDQKEVRLLQEMLLEDGELHSDGQRSRKFQWKNLDENAFFAKPFGDSDDENGLIDDDDLGDSDVKSKNWRQIRHERETFLSQQEKKNELLLSVEDEENSNFVRISSTTKITIKSILSGGEPSDPAPSKSPNAKSFLPTQFKCGSFLSRGKLLLNRLAATVGESKENIQGAKNSRNFVFAARGPEKEITAPVTLENKTEKRKISSKSVMAAKKLKMSKNMVDENSAFKNSGLLAQLAFSDC